MSGPKVQKRYGLEMAEYWLQHAKIRVEGKRTKEKCQAQLSLVDKEDDLICYTQRPPPYNGPPPQVQVTAQSNTFPVTSTPVKGTASEQNPNSTSSISPESSSVLEMNRSILETLTDAITHALGAPAGAKRLSKPPIRYGVEDGEEYPLIEVPNPRGGQNEALGQPYPLTMTVFRPWTDSDIQKATEHIKHPKLGPAEFIENIEGLRNSYKLNGVEVERALRRVLGSDWASVKGDWDPCAPANAHGRGDPLPPESPDLGNRLTALLNRCQLRWVQRTDWQKINMTVQEDKESVSDYLNKLREIFRVFSGLPEAEDVNSAYQQQLKIAFLNGLKQDHKDYIVKNMVTYRTASVLDVLQYAKHSEKYLKAKAKKNVKVKVFMQGDEGEEDAEEYTAEAEPEGSHRGRITLQK
ncbi:uncharacterized protein LOC143995940 [Lithobates pipiens]